MAQILPAILALRRDPRLLRVPPYLSALFVLVGLIWLFLLPLNEYSRHTYISENALLPGQVHTYFGGSEEAVFSAYRYEILDVVGKDQATISARLKEIFQSADLKPAGQTYEYHVAGKTFKGENVYAVLRAPRGDATEAVVLAAAWINDEGLVNINGVALVLTLSRYFTRWSLWSKDIIILISPDSRAGPQAWVDAYHDERRSNMIAPLPLKSGALQGAIIVDDALDHKFNKLHIVYDGINGQLPNLDLINTAVSVASGQMGIGIALQRMWKHDDSYIERLQTMLRGMVNQGAGHSHGPHSSFFPYHVDAITLQAVGDGPYDDMALGRIVEGIFRSLNNLLEHFHQSFFFYILMQADRFVSVGTYLPSAMLVAANFSIMAIALWIRSGRPRPSAKVASTESGKDVKGKVEMEVIEQDGMTTVAPKAALKTVERHLFLPVLFVAAVHFFGLVPLYTFNRLAHIILPKHPYIAPTLLFLNLNIFIPLELARRLRPHITSQHRELMQCFSLLLLGMFLATLATLNFSLSLFIGLLATPLSFLGPALEIDDAVADRGRSESDGASTSGSGIRGKEGSKGTDTGAASGDKADSAPTSPRPRKTVYDRRKVISWAVLQLLSPLSILFILSFLSRQSLVQMVAEAAFGWEVNGMWTQIVVWCVWWPAWMTGAVLVEPFS